MSALRDATGRDRDGWFAVLDGWGAAGRPYREIADRLTGEEGLSAWWAQKLIVEYEQARGVREPGARPDGTFAAGASKTVAAELLDVEAAFLEPARRRAWLPALGLRERSSTPGRSLRFDVDDGTRLHVELGRTSGGKTRIAVEQERIADAATAAAAKQAWRERLAGLQALLER